METVIHTFLPQKGGVPAKTLRINHLFGYSYGTRLALLSSVIDQDCLSRAICTTSKRAQRLTMHSYRSFFSTTKVLSVAALALAFSGSPAHAQASLSGTYNCVTVEVDGKAHHCKAPSLEMNSDGSYQILDERGTYEILKGNWLVLSASKNHGKARLDGSKEIIFEFESGGKKSKIIYRRKYQRPPGWVSSQSRPVVSPPPDC